MIKVRFAPSPTGHLHVGNAKTALFNYLFARKNGGTLILRMEDTDRERSEARYEESITDDLRWLGISWDEGPFRQSERMDIYRSYAGMLLDKGLAYKCFCTEEDLGGARQRSLAKGEPPRYSGKCRDISQDTATRFKNEGRPFTIRFRADQAPIKFIDGIRGELAFPRGHVDDLIILRNDGTPTYNLAVVVDDMLMGITHVIRGSDHISNTPKQIALIDALGGTAPRYAHHSLLIGPDHKPLSKRHGATRIIDFRSLGIVRDALINYLGTMGRNILSGIMDSEELAKTFSLESVSASDNIFDMDKLLLFNREYIKGKPLQKLMDEA
ncbi:MAG: glutamate--tRNA ligase, partial [Syntrophorhabdaceae bacterium]